MLVSLHIENIAVIRRLDVDFSRGFHALTGETGAGKSILIDSIRLLLGARSDKELVRNGEEKAVVSALFSPDTPLLAWQLRELGLAVEEGESLLLERQLTADGRSTAKIDGRSVSTALLKQVGRLLISIHGQHDTMLLLDPDTHLELLDLYGETSPLLQEYSELYKEITATKAKLQALQREEKDRVRNLELLRYQIKEIDSAKLHPGEEKELEARRDKLAKAEKLTKNAKIVYRSLYQNEKGRSAMSLLEVAKEAIEGLGDALPGSAEMAEKLENFRAELEDIAEQAYAVCDFGDEDPTVLLSETESRLDLIERLSAKYGDGSEAILRYRAQCAEHLKQLENSAALLSDCKKKLATLATQAKAKAEALSTARKSAARRLEDAVKRELTYLDLEKVDFKVGITDSIGSSGNLKLLPSGMDVVEFLLSANAGEPLKPLMKIASGGELSRIMLALKCVFAEKDRVPSLIFDEIDTGVSGKTSEKIGVKLREIGKTTQVFCVTHAARIAALADRQYLIYKEEKDGRTETSLRELDEDGRIKEIARIIGGIEITKTVMDTAKEMLVKKDDLES